MNRVVSSAAAACAALLVCLAPRAARAEWWPFGNHVATINGEQIWPRVIADERGGGFVTWFGNGNVHVQHLARSGATFPGWPEAGLVLPPAANPFVHFKIVPVAFGADGLGGLYALSSQGGPCSAHCGGFFGGLLAVQRLAAGGEVVAGWPAGGLQAFPDQHDEQADERAYLQSAGDRGVLVSIGEWNRQALFGPIVEKVLRVQSITPDASRRWGGSGVVVATGLGLHAQSAMAPDGRGGAFVFWVDYDSALATASVHGQHISKRGRPVWGAQGLVLSRLLSPAIEGPLVVQAGEDMLLAWTARSASRTLLYATRVSPSGHLPWKTERLLRNSNGAARGLQVAWVHGGVIASWLDDGSPGRAGVYAQCMGEDGRRRWSEDGLPVCTAPGSRGVPQLAADGRDGAYVAWSDTRPEGRLYATRLDARGRVAPGWAADGTVVSTWMDSLGHATDPIDGPYLAATARGEVMVAWESWQRVLSRPDEIYVEQSFAMLLTPDGPAASPVSAQRLGALADPIATAPALAPRTAFALRGVQPNPAPAGATVTFALPDARPASLELFDVAGRRVWSREVGVLGAGEHVVPLRDGVASPPGLYLIRLRQGEQTATARVVLVR